MLVLGFVLLAAVTTLAVRQARAEPLFFLPAPPPQQVGQVVVVPGPGGLAVYMGLRAADGRPTRGDGQAALAISDGRGVIYRTVRQVRSADFVQVRLPGEQGPVWALLYGFPWLSYEKDLGKPAAGPGQAQITMTTTQGSVLYGAATINFSP